MIKLVLKDKRSITSYFLSTNSDLQDDVNKFYISIAGKTITVNGFCEEDNVFICKEYPEYAIPMEFISHKYIEVGNQNNWTDRTYAEIAEVIGFTPEAARVVVNKTVEKIKKIVEKNGFKEYINA